MRYEAEDNRSLLPNQRMSARERKRCCKQIALSIYAVAEAWEYATNIASEIEKYTLDLVSIFWNFF